MLIFIIYYMMGPELKLKGKEKVVKTMNSSIRLFGLEYWLNIYYLCDL